MGTIRQKWTQFENQSYPDIESCQKVRSLVDHVGELVAAQLLVVVDVPLLQHLLHPSQKLQIQMECLKWINRCLSGGDRLQNLSFLLINVSLEFILHLSHNLLDLLCSELAL